MRFVKFILIILLMTAGCLEEPVVNPVTVEIGGAEELLIYLEVQGDYINSAAGLLLLKHLK